MIFGQSIEHLDEGSDGLAVTIRDGSRRDYTLVFGCDGNRSGLLPPNVSQIYSVPGRTALPNGYDGQTDIALAFRIEREIEYDYRDRAKQRRMVHEHFDGLGWKVPTLLAYVDADDDFLFRQAESDQDAGLVERAGRAR